MNTPPAWTTAADISAKLLRLWNRGALLASPPEGEAPLFPLTISLSRPDAAALSDHFDAVRHWIRELEAGSKTARGFGYEIVWKEINHRQLGRNRVPQSVVVPSPPDAFALIGKRRQAERFFELSDATRAVFPELESWISRRPLDLLSHEAEWERVLGVLRWLREHPRSGIYLRQLEIPEVDTKFIEARKGLLTELLDRVLPPEAIRASESGTRNFELRYGLLPKPLLVRFRVLDPALQLGSLSDITTPAAQFAQLELDLARVFITENEINGLAFPPVERSAVVFGLGYGLERLSDVPWLTRTAIYYWGDLDSHGFAILDRLRARLPHARSFLMDRDTLLAHRALWTRDETPHDGPLWRLTEEERRAYEELKSSELPGWIRLEQERIGFAWLKRALGALDAASACPG